MIIRQGNIMTITPKCVVFFLSMNARDIRISLSAAEKDDAKEKRIKYATARF